MCITVSLALRLLLLRTRFSPSTVHYGLVADKVALIHIFLQSTSVFSWQTSLQQCRILIYHWLEQQTKYAA